MAATVPAQDAKAVVAAFLEAMASGRPERVEPFLADDLTWAVVDRAGQPTDKAGLLAAIEGFAGLCARPLVLTPRLMVAEGDHVVVEVHTRAELTSGKVYDNQVAFVFEVRDGRLAAGREYCDTAYVHATFAA